MAKNIIFRGLRFFIYLMVTQLITQPLQYQISNILHTQDNQRINNLSLNFPNTFFFLYYITMEIHVTRRKLESHNQMFFGFFFLHFNIKNENYNKCKCKQYAVKSPSTDWFKFAFSKTLRGLERHGNFQTILTFMRRRALYYDIGNNQFFLFFYYFTIQLLIGKNIIFRKLLGRSEW